MKISIVIPTFNRAMFLKKCLESILKQKLLPYEVIVVDNAPHREAEAVVDNLRLDFNSSFIKITYIRNKENSGAIARNIGASKATGDLVAFLDDDVILDSNYYFEIIKVFLEFPDALGVHGHDKESFNFAVTKLENSLIARLINSWEKIFIVSSYFEDRKSRVLPSLCVTNPHPRSFDRNIQSEWVSTCAGVFSKKVFDNHAFDSKFKKYSWNEYVDFSYAIFCENPNSLFVTPHATYINVYTEMGRLQPKELIYMAEVYDLYIFIKRFDMSISNILIYSWSKFGRMIYNLVRMLIRHPSDPLFLFYQLHAPFYVMMHISKIKKGNLEFFNKTLS